MKYMEVSLRKGWNKREERKRLEIGEFHVGNSRLPKCEETMSCDWWNVPLPCPTPKAIIATSAILQR